MKQEICPNCGANEFSLTNGYLICAFCNSKFKASNTPPKTTISLKDDIERLLQKCEDEPWNSARYINLILDIDPTNKEVNKYLMREK